MISHSTIPTVHVVIKVTPPLGPSSSQSTRTFMARRYTSLVLPGHLNAMHLDYPSKIAIFDNTGAYTT